MEPFVKVVLGGSFDGMDQFADIIKVSKSGLDTGWMTKRASVSERIRTIRPEAGKTMVHLLALGDGETYGCNRNGDYFSKQANQVFHKAFETNARFYRHHVNKDPARSYGEVKVAEYNPNMHRVELVVALDNNKCAEELDLLEKKGEFPVSMACRVPFDVCSICDNKAPSRDSYCDHAKFYLTKIAADGRQVYVDNTKPTFFDISRVRRPADRIAWTFEKVAGEGVVSGADIAAELGYSSLMYMLDDSDPVIVKKAEQLARLSKLEQDITVWAQDHIKQAATSREMIPDSILDKVAAYCTTPDKLRDVIGEMTARRIMLKPYEFFKLAANAKFDIIRPELYKISAYLPGIFSKVENKAAFCKDATYDSGTGLIPRTLCHELDKVTNGVAWTIEAAQMRLIKSAAEQYDIKLRLTAEPNTPGIIGLATEYAKYQLGFLTKCAGAYDMEILEYLTITSNHVR